MHRASLWGASEHRMDHNCARRHRVLQSSTSTWAYRIEADSIGLPIVGIWEIVPLNFGWWLLLKALSRRVPLSQGERRACQGHRAVGAICAIVWGVAGALRQ